ncbi:MAG: sugar ABC transporter substrate-binding protein [Bifidobacterium sp.]|nr:sugar ABC transporter substrate-binding protein [Bifidobacterium sp.]
MGFILRIVVGILAGVAVATLASCEPRGQAVGDTQHAAQDVAHDADPGAPLTVAVIGAIAGARADSLVTGALKAGALEPYYVPCADLKDEAAGAEAAADGIRDAVRRHVKLIMVLDLLMDDDTEPTWTAALKDARDGGIPVVLVDPVDDPPDALLFAATFTIDERAKDATPIATAAKDVIVDAPHARDITVSTLTGGE